jgi:DNA-binding NtrC family response regulator
MGSPIAKESPDRRNRKPLIFIVDDEPLLLELAGNILASAGYDVNVFGDPAVALRTFAAAKPPPDLVITDYAMGGLSGTDLIRECRRVHPAQKIILLSGTADESVFAHSPQKPDRFMPKPYSPAALVELVGEILST